MALMIRRNTDESWRDAVQRVAGKHGLSTECLEEFDYAVAAGEEEGQAAWAALYEWDCLDYAPDAEDEA